MSASLTSSMTTAGTGQNAAFLSRPISLEDHPVTTPSFSEIDEGECAPENVGPEGASMTSPSSEIDERECVPDENVGPEDTSMTFSFSEVDQRGCAPDGNVGPEDTWMALPSSEIGEAASALDETVVFRGYIDVPGMSHQFPEQSFTETCVGNWITLRNEPEGKWPTIIVDARRESEDSDFRVKALRIERADNSVEAWLLFSRLWFLMAARGGLSIIDQAGKPLKLSPKLDRNWLLGLRGRCSVVRKLSYIESAFNQTFSVPETISAQEIYMAEVAFRAITEGEFTLRQEDWTFRQLMPADLSLEEPPFRGAGSFSHEWNGSVEDRRLEFLGSCLDLGPFTITIDKAEIANPWVLEGNEHDPVDIRFVVYDSQVSFRFEDYAGLADREANLRRLEEFKRTLASEEPKELVALIDRSLQVDVSPDEAGRIAMGWLEYEGFPDRYCAQEPALDRDAKDWRVPISFAYCDGRGGPVGHLIVDRTTGVVVDHTPTDAMRSEGAAIAGRLLDAK
ncbi:MAG TPA: hypothetical protein VI756_05745 [Blastocatellia bacterium]